jgi:hypothetical protein
MLINCKVSLVGVVLIQLKLMEYWNLMKSILFKMPLPLLEP